MQLAGRVPHSAVAQLGCSGRHHSNLLQRCTLTNSIRGPLNTADSSDTVLPSNALAKRRFSSGRSLHSRARQKLPACTTAFKRDRFISSSQVCSAEVIHSSSPQVQFGTTADLLTSLRAFTAMQKPTLSDVCTVQVQLKLAENKAIMDNHHGNSFAKRFLSEDGMAEVLKLLHHPDKYIHREAFRFARALCQQRWVSRELVGRKFVARVVPLMGRCQGDQSAEACRLVGQILTTGHQGGFARDVAQQVVDADGLDALATSLEASPQVMLGPTAEMLGRIASAGSHLCNAVTASSTVCTLADVSSAALISGARHDQAPAVEARTPQLFAAFKTLSDLAVASVQCGPSATLALVSSGAFTALVQMQAPWFAALACTRRQQSRATLRAIAGHHPTQVQAALRGVEMPFSAKTSPREYLDWWQNLRIDLDMPYLGV